MPKRNLLKVINQLDQDNAIHRRPPDGGYDPEGWWNCSWQEYGSAGTLSECIEMVSNYILSDLEELMEAMPELCKIRLDKVKYQCLAKGSAGVEDWWSIWYGGETN
jgi:hypothetical protein